MHKSKEIELSTFLKAGRFIPSEEIAEKILYRKELMKIEDDKVTTEKEKVLLLEGQRA